MKAIRGGFIILFIAMLTLPLVFVDLSSNRVSVAENRMLAGYPRPADIKNHPDTFLQSFDAWFKDSTGFRKQFIKLYNIIDKNTWLNGLLYKDGEAVYLIGEKGHHYYAGNPSLSLIEKFQGKQFLSDEQLKNMTDKLEEVKTYLDRMGIPFVVMFCTVKESIYPEFYPKLIKRGPEPIQLDVITNYLRENTSVDVFNIRQALLEEKDNYLLYNVSYDVVHYNEIGAFFAYRELMKHINIHFPEIVPYELNDIDISYNEKGIPDVSLKTETTYKRLDQSFFDDIELIRPFIWENGAYENNDTALPVILFLRDSYTGYFYGGGLDERKYITQFIASHFGWAIFIHFQYMEHFEEYVTKYKPDIVVFESSEHQLRWFADCAAGISELP
jgi:hypothetical protein